MNIMTIIITATITTLIGAIVGGAIAWVGAKNKMHKDNKEAEEKNQQTIMDVLKVLIHDSYFRCCKELIDEDEITDAEYENFTQLHNSYTSLGMNGRGEWYYQQIKDKPTKTE